MVPRHATRGPIERLALLRLDGDLCGSTFDTLAALYPRLSPGGYTVVDDYGSFEECHGAVHDYLDAAGEKVDIQRVDDEGCIGGSADSQVVDRLRSELPDVLSGSRLKAARFHQSGEVLGLRAHQPIGCCAVVRFGGDAEADSGRLK